MLQLFVSMLTMLEPGMDATRQSSRVRIHTLLRSIRQQRFTLPIYHKIIP